MEEKGILSVTITIERYKELIEKEKVLIEKENKLSEYQLKEASTVRLMELDIRPYVLKRLDYNKITTVDELISKVESRSLLRCRDIGVNSFNDIVYALKKANLIDKSFIME